MITVKEAQFFCERLIAEGKADVGITIGTNYVYTTNLRKEFVTRFACGFACGFLVAFWIIIMLYKSS